MYITIFHSKKHFKIFKKRAIDYLQYQVRMITFQKKAYMYNVYI